MHLLYFSYCKPERWNKEEVWSNIAITPCTTVWEYQTWVAPLGQASFVPSMQALVYLTGECNYGGRVTDSHDRRTLVSILSVIYRPEILEGEYKLSASGTYYVPEDCEYHEYIEHIKKFPLLAMPEVFGLHENADITKDQQEVDLLLSAILSTQVTYLPLVYSAWSNTCFLSKDESFSHRATLSLTFHVAYSQSQTSTAGGQSREELILDIVVDQLKRLPPTFDLELARYMYPVRYEESMNSVLVQEMVRFNRLTDVCGSIQPASQVNAIR